MATARRKKKVAKKKVAKKKATRKLSARKAAADIIKKTGRPTLYRAEFCADIIDFFTVPVTKTEIRTTVSKKTGEPVNFEVEVPNELPTLQAYAAKIGVSTFTIWNWTKHHPDFEQAVARAKELAENHIVQNGLKGHYNPGFAIFVAKNYTPMRDVQTHETANPAPPRTGQEIEERIRQLDDRIAELRGQL